MSGSHDRERRFRISVRALILIVAAMALGLGALRRFGPLTPAEASRVAFAEVARRDPEFARNATVFEISADEVNVGRLWNWAYQWEVILKRNDAANGYLVKLNGRGDVKAGRVDDINYGECSWEIPQ